MIVNEILARVESWRRFDALEANDHNPSRKNVIQGFEYTKRLLVIYHVSLVGVLGVATLFHWGRHSHEWRRRRQRYGKIRLANSNPSGTSSSSSSTLFIQNQENESIRKDGKQVREPHTWSSLRLKSRSFLNFQPKPIPIVNKTLPENKTTILVLLLLAMNGFFLFFRTTFSKHTTFVAADRAGALFVANLPWLYLLSAKNQPIKRLTGMSYECLNIYHRRLGELVCLLGLLHSIGMVAVWYTLLQPVGISFIAFISIKLVYFGLFALTAYLLLYFTSLGSFRQRWYELFLKLHVGLQIAALGFLFFHHHGTRIYVGLALAIFLVDALFYRMFVKSVHATGSLKATSSCRTALLSVQVPLHQPSFIESVLGTDISAGWRSTDHVFLSTPSTSWKDRLSSHPFTIASRAPSDDEVRSLDFIVRARTGFSQDLLDLAGRHSSIKVRIDGPYGSQNAVTVLESKDVAVVVAGGSGVAVTWPLVWSLLSRSDFESQQDQRILFIWIIQEDSHLSWLGEGALDELRDRGVEVMIPPSTREHGRPDIAAIISDWTTKKCSHLGGNSRVGVVCSGPDDLNRSIRNTCARLMRVGQDVEVDVEKFGW